ncbi:MAG: anaerobic carbon-monoxide dehydrogenase catalytic subunit [Bacillota bacterium]
MSSNDLNRAMFEKALRDGASTALSRVKTVKPCPTGVAGACCRMCSMGPCRVFEDKGPKAGVCGATAETIAARNFCRMIAAGTAAHSDHAREVVNTFLKACDGQAPGFAIRDEAKLRTVARVFGLEWQGKSTDELARQVGEAAKAEFGRQDGDCLPANLAPVRRREAWRRAGVFPRGIDREVVETLHRTQMGVDQDAWSLMLQATRCALADGWGGSMIATALQDILFGTPRPLRAKVNVGVLREDQVNVVVHGHEPLLPEILVALARDPELLAEARAAGASGINLAGICCSANELLMRHGVPVAGSFLQQELAIATGAVDLMAVDGQCVMQGLAEVARCYHMQLVTTSSRARLPGVEHVEFHPETALETGRELLRRAIANFPRRGKVAIPKETMDLVAGFGHESIEYILGGRYRASYRPLVDNIVNGRIRGIAGVVGCSNPRAAGGGDGHSELVRKLIANNVLVLATGCAAISLARDGLLRPEAASEAGPGLAEVCEAVGIPPVLHCGACVDNSRLLAAASALACEGGLGEDIADIPVAGCAPEWMSEKALAIGQYFVASGIPVGLGVNFPGWENKAFRHIMTEQLEGVTGAGWFFEPDPERMADRLTAIIDARRRALGLDRGRERVLFDMEMRRKLDV